MHFWALVKLRWLWVLGLMLRLSCLCFCGDSNLDLKCLYLIFFFKFKDGNLCLNWNRVFFFCQDLRVLKVIHNLWSIIDGIIVKNFLEYILVLLREDGDDQPLILQTKLILKETLMIVADSALSLIHIWRCRRAI